MFAEVILAAALLASPKDTQFDPALIETVRPSLIAIGLDAGVIDPREKHFLFMQDPQGDLAMIQGRMEDMKDCPELGECYRFPDRKTVNDFLAMNRAFRNNLQLRLAIDCFNEAEIRTAIIETDQLYQIWDTVRDANCDYYYVTVRRQALRLLRDLIGAEAFYSGNMPPPIPIWHLPRSR